MVEYYVVEYKFNNGLSSEIKRQKFKKGAVGHKLAREKYIAGVKWIKWNQSEDYEQIELQVKTTNNGTVVLFHYDTLYGYKNANPQEVFCDG